ncbi:MAG: polysaccharide biosynthesis protein, partial [Rickettsiales bacterium]
MLRNVVQYLNSLLNYGNNRTVVIKKNITISIIFKGISVCISLVLIPLTIKYISPSEYGIWITLSSLVSWFNFFDIGLGNGLRNNVAECNAKKEFKKAKIYVSTTYVILTVLSTVMFIVFVITNHYLNWEKILNIHHNISSNLSLIVIVVFGTFCVQFVNQLINNVLYAYHVASKVALISLVSQFVTFVNIVILTTYTCGNLLYLAIALTCTPVVIQLLFSIFYYKTQFKLISPNIRFFDFQYIGKLLSIGTAFLIIQIGGLILFETDNIIIIQYLDAKSVTIFNLSNKLFSLITIVFTIIMTPIWSAFTDA